MCNLYRMTKATAEVARIFGVTNRAEGGNRGELVFPGFPGLVIAESEVRQMNWGFPLQQVSRKTGKPIKPKTVTNTRDDKLHSPFWRDSFTQRRCLIPLTAFAEAEGEYGSMTRTWLSVPDEETFAIAGIWRNSQEWGPVYSMVTSNPNTQTAAIHDRMPVVLHPADHARWTDGTPDEAISLCQPYSGTMIIERTSVPWVER
ncbi:MAG TPA: SOS response-associated peptidase family protein [Devosia sp.]|uniref:SOS response-associated peptidase n=1 Tax=Pararhizobium sp. TaxID=1977563 RepID=UPI002C6A979B|nr:SOS response-associated peptidase family protein [Pararhizobium sp.]HTN60943.1 SOS response-associated peptidase family protein [Devosia sp.]HTO32589.1 SOS response-associated peptidase family protein [Pararhizobium sp.]